jgi:hypothetical protein
LGAIIGRTPGEKTKQLAHNVWLKILMDNLDVSEEQRAESQSAIDFAIPLRRKFPIGQPAIYERLKALNKGRLYDDRVKPFGFVQTVVPDTQIGSKDTLPIAPYNEDARASMKLQWIDFRTGNRIALDWFDTGHANAIGVMRLDGYIEAYQRHAEAKAADSNGDPAGEDTVGLLSRLAIESTPVLHIGKEVDRLDADRGSSLMTVLPVEYEPDDLAESIAALAVFPQKEIASAIEISERAWRSILKGLARPHGETASRIRLLAAKRRSK